MRQMRRAMHFDFHTMPGIDGLLSEFSAKDFAKSLADAGVEYINFPARCNIGFSYYNTRIGKKYPGLERDILAEVIEECHKYGIGVSAYINIGLNHELSVENYGWLRINRDGRIYKENKVDNFFRTMCMNSDYREYMYSEIREILEYDVDGIFCDCLVTRECYCPRCIEKMRERAVNIKDPDAVIAYQVSVIRDVYREIRDMVGDSLYLYINSNKPIPGIHTHAEVECLPSSKHWGSDYFYPAATYMRTQFDKLVYMTGRFQDCWGDLGGLKTTEAMENDLFDALTAGYGISISDHLHPKYGLVGDVINRAKVVFQKKLEYEKYDQGMRPLCEVGILASDNDYAAPEYLRGAARMLCELHIPYNTYAPSGDFSRMRLVIIPRALPDTDRLYERIRAFASEGGKVIFIGEGLDLAKTLGLDSGITDLKEDGFDNSYFLLPDGDMRWAAYAPSRRMKKGRDGRELARYVEGIFNLEFDGHECYFYRPQGEPTDESAAIVTDSVGYVSYNAFDAYAAAFLKETKILVGRVIDSLLPDREILTEGLPSTAIVGLSGRDTDRIAHIKVTYPSIRNGRGIVEEHNYLPEATVSVRGEFTRVSLIPSDTPIDFTVEGGRTVFKAKEILGYGAYLLTK